MPRSRLATRSARAGSPCPCVATARVGRSSGSCRRCLRVSRSGRRRCGPLCCRCRSVPGVHRRCVVLHVDPMGDDHRCRHDLLQHLELGIPVIVVAVKERPTVERGRGRVSDRGAAMNAAFPAIPIPGRTSDQSLLRRNRSCSSALETIGNRSWRVRWDARRPRWKLS